MKKSILFTMLLAGLTLWLGCEKDNFNLPQENVQQPALQIPTDMAALLSAEELNYLETSFLEAWIEHRDEDLVLPVMIQMDVYLSYPANREGGPGNGDVDVAISGSGLWPETGPVTYFEIQSKPDPQGFWVGEGSIRTMNTPFPMYLFFTSIPDPGGSNGCVVQYVMSAKLNFNRGSGEFRGVSGEALRKVFVSEDDYGKGVVLICGHVVLPAGASLAPFEVEMENGDSN